MIFTRTLLACLLLLPSVVSAQDISGREIMERVEDNQLALSLIHI